MRQSIVLGGKFNLSNGVTIKFADSILLSLNCPICRRSNRSVFFSTNGESRCSSSGHSYPGKLLSKIAHDNESNPQVMYMIDILFHPFRDQKHGSLYENSGIGSWLRMSFTVNCPECGHSSSTSTQNNISRPYSQRCKCGYVLFTEDELPFETDEIRSILEESGS